MNLPQDFMGRIGYLLSVYGESYLVGAGKTMAIALVGTLVGCLIGFAVGIVQTIPVSKEDHIAKRILLWIVKLILNIYVEFFRGTPMMVQLLIMWFVIWPVIFPGSTRATDGNLIRCAVLAFGINSGAYVAEIVRSGIMSIDKGQMEAGRSLGLNYFNTMRCIIVPQAFKNVLPALGNELITLLKETSIVTVIGLKDLTKGAMIVQANTYQALVPFLAIAAIYLMMVMLLTWLLGKMERRLRKSDLR